MERNLCLQSKWCGFNFVIIMRFINCQIKITAKYNILHLMIYILYHGALPNIQSVINENNSSMH